MAHAKVLPVLKASVADWTYLSPAAFIAPGERTGKFRLGDTDLVTDAKGESRISAEDYAIALVDELKIRSTSTSSSPLPTESAAIRRAPAARLPLASAAPPWPAFAGVQIRPMRVTGTPAMMRGTRARQAQ